MARKALRVGDLMSRHVTTMQRNDTLDMAEGLMILGSIRHIPVVDEGKLVGMLSSRDLFRSAIAFALGYGEKGRNSLQRLLRVKEVMREPVVSIDPVASVGEAARRMVENKIGALPVVENGLLVGVITETDLLRYVIGRTE